MRFWGKRAAVLLLAGLLLILCPALPVFAEDGGLSAHSSRIAESRYHGVRIVCGFVPGTRTGDAAREFENGGRIVFRSLRGDTLSSDALLCTGVLLCPDGSSALTDAAFAAVFGDMDGDGKATAADARLSLRSAAGLEEPGALPLAAGDCDRDGRVSSVDARRILRHAARLETIENPIGLVPADSVPVSLAAYYMGDDPVAGRPLPLDAVRVIVSYNDARTVVLSSGFTVEPDPPVAVTPGEHSFTVRYQGLSAPLTVRFVPASPTNCYPGTHVPSLTDLLGREYVHIRYQYHALAYEYAVDRMVEDMGAVQSYTDELLSCGFVCTQSGSEQNAVGAIFRNEETGDTAAVVFDFTLRKIYVFAAAE